MANKENSHKRDEITCIQLPKELRDKLADMGKKTETFADIVRRLVDSPCQKTTNSEAENENE